MSKLIIDLNSIVTSALLVGKDPDAYKEDGEEIRTWEYGYSNFLSTYRKTLDTLDLTPMHTIGVFDAEGSRKRRQSIYPAYKEHRKKRPDAYYEEFNKCMSRVKLFIQQLGGIILSAKRSEADDTIAAIANRISDAIIWTKDKDLISIGPAVWMDGELINGLDCGSRFIPDLPRKYIRLYRALVSDPGDFGPGMGAAGFGEKAFINLWVKFGDEGLDDVIRLIENKQIKNLAGDVPDFAPLAKIIESEAAVYTTWALAGWLPIKLHHFNWEPGFTNDRSCETYDSEFDEFYQNCTLVTADNLESVLGPIQQFVDEANFVPIDIETDVPDESRDWLKTIYDNLGKRRAPIQVDVLESKIVGMSLTAGDNLQHTYYFSINHADTNNITTEQAKEIILSIKKPKIAHNAFGFEIPVFFMNWGEWVPGIYCSQIAAGYVDENNPKGLKMLSYRYYGYKQTSYADVVGIEEAVVDDEGEAVRDKDGVPKTTVRLRGMSELTGVETTAYGCDDTIMGGHLFNFFELVMDVEETFNAYAAVETDAMYMTALSFVNGATVDLDLIASLKEEDEKAAEEAQKKIDAYLIKMGWEGSVFEPLVDASVAEIKRGYNILTGEPLSTRFRLIEKVAAVILAEAENTRSQKMYELINAYGELVAAEDVGGLNQLLSDNFVPRVDFKCNSAPQKQKLLYEVMNLPIRYRNQVTDTMKAAGLKEGAPSTDDDVIQWAKKDATEEEAEVLDSITRVVNFKTRDGLFYTSYPLLTHWNTGKIHPSLKQSSTTSRRFAPAGPNVNQQPKRSEEGRKIRGAIKPHHKDAVIIAPDFSGQELRVGAEETQDPASLACFIGENLKDQHTITAFAICQKQKKEFETYEEFEAALEDKNHKLYKEAKEYRGVKAKPTNFLSQYVDIGGGAWQLGKQIQIPEDLAQEFLDARSSAFPGIDIWKKEYGEKVQAQGYAETFMGAKKHIMQLFKFGDFAHIIRSALNFRIQSSSAEMTKLVMGAIWRSGIMFKYDVQFYYPVHDELVFSVAKKDLAAFAAELKPIMHQKYAYMTVPIVSSFCVGHDFANLDEIAWEGCEDWLAKDAEKAKSCGDLAF
jgi:DNA polymerase I-like protein with 3'-5' exonuclease and polymerase domains/5'-3' exonuclease